MTPRPSKKPTKGLAAEERSAIRARVKELRWPKGGGEPVALAAVAKMPAPYRVIGERIHQIVMESAPGLQAKTWYGLPAYAKDGKVVCYMRMNPKSPFNDRYLTFGFNEAAKLDADAMWPIAFAVTKLGSADESKIAALVKKAVG
jgi:uncharacterized protein YdhG (YjbR/CyaY superfamily)